MRLHTYKGEARGLGGPRPRVVGAGLSFGVDASPDPLGHLLEVTATLHPSRRLDSRTYSLAPSQEIAGERIRAQALRPRASSALQLNPVAAELPQQRIEVGAAPGWRQLLEAGVNEAHCPDTIYGTWHQSLKIGSSSQTARPRARSFSPQRDRPLERSWRRRSTAACIEVATAAHSDHSRACNMTPPRGKQD